MGKEYLVKGAKLMCVNGKGISELNVVKGHGYTQKGKAKANCKDCIPGINIPYFKTCQMNIATHMCEGYMKISREWENVAGGSVRTEQVGGENAITLDSVLICDKGGLILPITSGQEDVGEFNSSEFKNRYQKAVNWAKGKNPNFHVCRHDPINMNTGSFLYEKEDLVIPGIKKLSFHMFYDSMDEKGGSIGIGWHHSHETHIRKETGGMLYLCRGDGKEIPYRSLTTGMYAPVMGDRGLLAENGKGFRYADGEGEECVFDCDGKLLERKDRNGNADFYIYNSHGQLTSVKGANGGELFFRYNQEDNLIEVKDHAGREIRLWYQYGKLWKFVNASGHAYTYAYNEAGWLESVVTPRGITGFMNEYDSVGRVVKQTMPDGSFVELSYDDEGMMTRSKEPDGGMIYYESDDRSRNIRTVYHDGEERFGYNDRNLRVLYVDRRGNETRYRYDEQGNLTGIVNALGEETVFSRDKEGRLLAASMGGKVLVSHVYDEKGRLTEACDPLGRSRKTEYDEKGLPVKLILPDGSSFSVCWDERGNVEKVIDPYGGDTSYVYDELNRVCASTDAEGNTTKYQYDERNHLLGVINPEGNVRTYRYNESGKPIEMEDFDKGKLSISYDVMGKPEKMTDKEGRETRQSYDERGNISEQAFPSGALASFSYDRDNRLARMEFRKSKGGEADTVMEYTYDPAGNLLAAKAGDGKEILSESFYGYDALNRVIEATDPAGGKTCYTYDRAGHISSITDPAGNQRFFHYNDAGELTEETDLRGNVTRYEYNLLGQVSAITDGVGRKVRHFYQLGGRLEKTIYADGRQIGYVYDKLGRVVEKKDDRSGSLFYEYDSMGRVVSVTGSEGQRKTYAYDAMGNMVSMTDAGGNTTLYEYTLSGKLCAVTDALGNRAEYAYDKEDNLIYICQKGKEGEGDRETFYERDSFGQVECIRDALGQEEHYTYDALGRMTLKTDREGYRTEYAYTADGKISEIAYGDGTKVEMAYTPLRQLALVKDWLGETRIERTVTGDVTSITDHKGRRISYEWGKLGERKEIIYPEGQKVRFHYDELLHLDRMRIEGGETEEITYLYDKGGRLSEKRMPKGLRTLWHYDERGQLGELIHEDKSGILDRSQYEYDFMGNKTAVTKKRRGMQKENGRYEYGYDALSRLISVSRDGEALRSYAYDTFGNRSRMDDFEAEKSISYAYDVLNRLVSTEENGLDELQSQVFHTDYFYDNRGNLVREEREGQLIRSYEYGAINRLSRAWNAEHHEAVYQYNGLGQRTGKEINGKMEEYLLDLTKAYHNLLEVRTEEGSQNFYFDWNAVAMEASGKGRRSEERRAFPGLHHYMQDELGSPLRVDGFRAEEGEFAGKGSYLVYGYDEFGNDIKEEKGNTGVRIAYDRQGIEQPFGYTGYRKDGISGTYFAQAREYSTGMGRFHAQDIIKGSVVVPITLNQYSYCWSDPMVLIDLDGRLPDEAHAEGESDYTGVFYLNSQNGAYTCGHAALMFVREDGSGTFYSFATSYSYAGEAVLGMYLPGYLSKAEVPASDMAVFFGNQVDEKEVVPYTGQIWTDAIDKPIMLDGSGKVLWKGTPYSRAIYIPITPEEGKAMSDHAEELRREPGEYNLYARNCGMVAQEILSMGGKDFAPGPRNGKQIDEQMHISKFVAQVITLQWDSAIQNFENKFIFDFLDMTMPNGAYYFGELQVNLFRGKEGWRVGDLEDFKYQMYWEGYDEK